MSNPNAMGREARTAEREIDSLTLDKETLKDLEVSADGSDAAKGGIAVGPISGILCFSKDCVSNGCATK